MKRSAVLTIVVSLFLIGIVKEAQGEWSFYNSNVVHKSQPETWICGPTTIAMWAGSITRRDLNPYGYVFSEWEYVDKEAAVKGIMWSIARFGEPVTVAGGNGSHYLLVRGGL